MNNIQETQENIADYIPKYTEYIRKDINFYRKDEGYKYGIVDVFRRNFDLDDKNLAQMLEKAFAGYKGKRNLFASGDYWPARMITYYAEADPEFMRRELKALTNEKKNIVERINNFVEVMEKTDLKKKNKKSYCDYRFASFILGSRNPQKYIPVKRTEFVKFASQVGYDLKPRGTPGEKFKILNEFGKTVKEVLSTSDDFLQVHKEITEGFNYKDPHLAWGTIDFIFNVARERWKEQKKTQEKRKKIHKDIEEYYSDITKEEKIEDEISQESFEGLITEGSRYKPPSESYIKKTGNYKVRNDSTKQKVIVKKLNNYSCQLCGFSFTYRDSKNKKRKYAHADHIVDKHEGGTEKLDNLWVLCPNCHAKKTFGVIRVDIKKKKVYENDRKAKFNPGHLKEFGW